ncbi:hypothetical protein EV650_3145 [Kribbella kalugense]|uniref:Uncharacterized protein n=1 Tax=Kribbella kalugense TaxID=2512221 RepID=A0A4R8A1I3_9ACTN|nr:hypothetical protein EV650_3145 [Kribbella kalugense]
MVRIGFGCLDVLIAVGLTGAGAVVMPVTGFVGWLFHAFGWPDAADGETRGSADALRSPWDRSTRTPPIRTSAASPPASTASSLGVFDGGRG